MLARCLSYTLQLSVRAPYFYSFLILPEGPDPAALLGVGPVLPLHPGGPGAGGALQAVLALPQHRLPALGPHPALVVGHCQPPVPGQFY